MELEYEGDERSRMGTDDFIHEVFQKPEAADDDDFAQLEGSYFVGGIGGLDGELAEKVGDDLEIIVRKVNEKAAFLAF